jgi:hypothetical protein
MVIQVLEKVTKEEERKREGLGSMQPSFSSVWHTGLSGAPGWFAVNSLLSEIDDGVRLKITELSGDASDCPVSQRSPTPMVGRAIFARHVDCSNGQLVHWTVRCAPDSVR